MPNSGSRHTSPINGPLNTDGPVPPRLRGSPFLAGVTPSSPPNQSPYSFVSTGNISDSALPQSIASGPWLDFVELPQQTSASGSTITLHQPKYTHAPSSQPPSFVARSGSTPRAASVAGGTRSSYETSNSPYQYASSSSPTSSVPSLGSTSGSTNTTPSSSPPASTASLSSPSSSTPSNGNRPGTPIPQVNPGVSYRQTRAKSPLGTSLHIPLPTSYPSFSSAPSFASSDADDEDAISSDSDEYFEAASSPVSFVIPAGQLRRRGQSTPSLGTTANMTAYFGAASLPPAVRDRLDL